MADDRPAEKMLTKGKHYEMIITTSPLTFFELPVGRNDDCSKIATSFSPKLGLRRLETCRIVQVFRYFGAGHLVLRPFQG